MSIYYYLYCDQHKKAIFITNNKGDPPLREEVIEFLQKHVYQNCEIKFYNEHTLPVDVDIFHINDKDS